MSCFYNNYNYNLNNQLGAAGTMSRFSGLLNTGSSYSIGNLLGGFGNVLSSYGMYGFGNGSYGLGNAMFNYNSMFGCGCGMSPWAQIGFTLANSFTTVFGAWGLSALADKISEKRSEAPVKQETLESVEKDLSAQLEILGIDNLTPSVDSKETILSQINAADQYSSTITTLNNEIKEYEGENGKIQQRKNQVTACDTEIKRLQGERDKEGITPEQKAEINKQIKTQEDLKAQYLKEQQQYEKELAAKKKELEKVQEKQKAETTAKGEAKRLLAKYNDIKTKAENEAKAAKEEEDKKILNKADGTKLSRKDKNIFDVYDENKTWGTDGNDASKITMGHMQDLLRKYDDETDPNRKKELATIYIAALADNTLGVKPAERRTLETVLPQMKEFIKTTKS